jgi:hypothetical protein
VELKHTALVRKEKSSKLSKSQHELPITTKMMAPFRHDMSQDESGNSYLKLSEKGSLIFYLAKKDKFIEIS